MSATSGFNEKLVHCDVGDLSVPEYTGDLIALKGVSPAQTTFASNMRTKKLKEWQPDLPENVYKALLGVSDATWWLANQQADSSNIGWPTSWTAASRNLSQPELSQPVSSARQSRERLAAAQPTIPPADIEKFDAFAKMACRSPEMSYMTMMALLYRQTKDPKVLEKFKEARRKVDGYLDAIDNIVGTKV